MYLRSETSSTAEMWDYVCRNFWSHTELRAHFLRLFSYKQHKVMIMHIGTNSDIISAVHSSFKFQDTTELS